MLQSRGCVGSQNRLVACLFIGKHLTGDSIVNVLCQLLVKYYVITVFVDEFNIPLKLKSHLFADICLRKRFSLFLREELVLQVCPRTVESSGGIVGE